MDKLPFDGHSTVVQDDSGCFLLLGSAFYQNPDNNLFIFAPIAGTSVSCREKTVGDRG